MHRGDSDSMRPVYEFPPLGVDGRLYCKVWLVGGWSKDRVTRYVVALFNTYTYVQWCFQWFPGPAPCRRPPPLLNLLPTSFIASSYPLTNLPYL